MKYLLIIFLIHLLAMDCALANGVFFTNTKADLNKITTTLSANQLYYLVENNIQFNNGIYIFLKGKRNNSEYEHINLKDATIEVQPFATCKIRLDGIAMLIILKDTGRISPFKTQITVKDNLFDKYDEIAIFGIEMVYIPEGEFYVGDSVSLNRLGSGVQLKPALIRKQISVCSSDTCTLFQDNNSEFSPKGNLNPIFPTGFHGFYVMRYEITQQQYADFLNTLTPNQIREISPIKGEGRYGTLISFMNRNGLVFDNNTSKYVIDNNQNGIGNEENDGKHRAMNFLNYAMLSAYLDWAGLRLMSELEFEKCARGFNYPVLGEFSFGSANIVDANQIVSDGTDSERFTDLLPDGFGVASHGYSGPQGPLRNGFSAFYNSTRLNSGAGFNGVMELSGNLWEIVVSISDSASLSYNGENGDGELSVDGYHNQPTWPSPKTAKGACFKGGAWNSGIFPPGNFRDLAISDRFYITLPPTEPRNTSGGRGAVTFP